MHELAIVIPAWKPDFFLAALESLRAQTDRRFTVYVADDGGPSELADTCRAFGDLDLVYHRFEENLGGTSLTAHWNRAIALSTEPWVWLFGDDDELHPDCVSRFLEWAASGDDAVSVLRFDTDVIDEQGRVQAHNPVHPAEETGSRFIFDRLLGRRNSYVVEYVFRRSAFDRSGGFPDYPAAWCADDVAWFTFSGDQPIVTIPGPRVRWRASRVNITGANRSHQEEKILAGRRFLDFVASDVEPVDAQRPGLSDPALTPEDWADARSRWLEDQVRYLSPLPASLIDEVTASEHWRRSRVQRLIFAHTWTLEAKWKTTMRQLSDGLRRRNEHEG